MPISPALDTTLAENDPDHIDHHVAIHTFLNDEAETEDGSQAKADSLALIVHRSMGFADDEVETFTRKGSDQIAPGSGVAECAYFTPVIDLTISKLAVWCASVSSGLTVGRMALYTAAANGDLTIVARTANDTTLNNTLAVAGGANPSEKSLDTTGGYPATYDLVAGQNYAIGLLLVGSGMGAIRAWVGLANQQFDIPRQSARKTGLSDLDGNLTSMSASTWVIWARASA